MSQTPIIFFDGVCNLCSGWVLFLIRIDKKERLNFASLQSEFGQKVMKSIGLKAENMDTVIYFNGEKYFFESDAVLKTLVDLSGIWKASNVFYLIPKIIRNYIYRLIVKNRYSFFGKRSTCMISMQDYEKRFLS